MNIKVGNIYQVKDECVTNCGDAEKHWKDSQSSKHYILIKELLVDDRLSYDVLDDKKAKITYCNCYKEKDLFKLANDGIIKSFMDNATDFYHNMTASKEDKLLKEMGLENPIGIPTEEGLRLSAFIQYKNNKAEIIKVAEAMKAVKDEAK
jgi:hypothetical protein